jgi:hypothetical protein
VYIAVQISVTRCAAAAAFQVRRVNNSEAKAKKNRRLVKPKQAAEVTSAAALVTNEPALQSCFGLVRACFGPALGVLWACFGRALGLLRSSKPKRIPWPFRSLVGTPGHGRSVVSVNHARGPRYSINASDIAIAPLSTVGGNAKPGSAESFTVIGQKILLHRQERGRRQHQAGYPMIS